MRKLIFFAIVTLLICTMAGCSNNATPPSSSSSVPISQSTTNTPVPSSSATVSSSPVHDMEASTDTEVVSGESDFDEAEFAERATEAYSNFVVEISPLFDDEVASRAGDLAHIYRVTYMESHAISFAELTDGTKEEWYALEPKERFLRYETYYRTLSHLRTGNFDAFFSSVEIYEKNAIGATINLIERHSRSGNEAEAYRQLMLLQYEYLMETGKPYDFIEGAAGVLDFDPTAEADRFRQEDERLYNEDVNELMEAIETDPEK